MTLPQRLAQPTDRIARQQRLACGILQRVLDLAHREPARIHLDRKSIQDIAVPPQEGDQARQNTNQYCINEAGQLSHLEEMSNS